MSGRYGTPPRGRTGASGPAATPTASSSAVAAAKLDLSALNTYLNDDDRCSASWRFRALELVHGVSICYTPIPFRDGDDVICGDFFELLFSPETDRPLRRALLTFLDAVLDDPKHPALPNTVERHLPGFGFNGRYSTWMMEQISSPTLNVDALRVWQVGLRFLGRLMHTNSNTSTLNALLSIAEKAFKSESHEIRQETFRTWRVLMDVFALNMDILGNPKRVRLLTRPLVAMSNTQKEPLARAKFQTWWYFIRQLQNHADTYFEEVVLTFVDFCYGRSGAQQTPAKQAVSPGPPPSPVKKYRSMPPLCLVALAELLGCGGDAGAGDKRVVLPLTVKHRLVSDELLIKHHRTVLHAVIEAYANLDFKSPSSVATFKSVFVQVAQTLHKYVKKASMDAEAKEAIGAYFVTVRDMVYGSRKNDAAHPLIMAMLHDVQQFPIVLLSAAPAASDEPVVVTMVKLMFHRDLVVMFANPELKETFDNTLHWFVQKSCCCAKSFGLRFFGQTTGLLHELAASAESHVKSEDLLSLWKTFAQALKNFANQHRDVNHSESALKHDYSSAEQLLSFPLVHLSKETNKGLWKQWVDLLQSVSQSVSLIVSYVPPELEAKLAGTMLTQLVKAPLSVELQQLANYARIFLPGLLKNVLLDKLGSQSQDKPTDLLMPIVNLLVKLMSLLSSSPQEQKATHLETAQNLCSATSYLLSHVSEQSLLHALLQRVVPQATHLVALIDSPSGANKAYEHTAETLVGDIVTAIQSRYEGAFDAALLADLKPFLLATMGHKKRSVKTKVQQMWQLTFATSLTVKDIPSDIAAILRKSLVLSSESSSSQGQEELAAPAPRSFLGLLNKASNLPKATKDADSNGVSPLRNFRKPEDKNKVVTTPKSQKKKAALVSLEDESSQDFVPITNSGKKKRQVLTDHQKDRMTTRRDDIPALYSELSAHDDSSVLTLPPQFASQASVDESSQMAVDTSEFKKIATRKSKNTAAAHIQSDKTECKPTNTPASESTVDESLQPVAQSTIDLASTQGSSDAATPSIIPPPSPLSSQSAEATSSPAASASSTSRRRKGSIPVKNLPPVTKRQPHAATPPGKKRGRPSKVSKAAEKTTSAKEAAEEEEAGVHVTHPEVKLARLSPEDDTLASRSPVKVVQENPLILASALAEEHDKENVVAAAAEDAMPAPEMPAPAPQPKLTKKRVAKELVFDSNVDEDIIESSQDTESNNTSRSVPRLRGENASRKRRRVSASPAVTLADKNTNSSGSKKEGEETVAQPPTMRPRPASNKENDSSQKKAAEEMTTTSTTTSSAKTKPVPKNKYGETPLHVAVKKGDLSKVRSLLESGADVSVQDNAGWTPLHEGMREGAHTLDIVQLLLEHGADVNAQADDGNTPLHDAVYMPEAVIRLLLGKGADTNVKNKAGQTPVDLAPAGLTDLFLGTGEVTAKDESSSSPPAKKRALPADRPCTRERKTRQDQKKEADTKDVAPPPPPSTATTEASQKSDDQTEEDAAPAEASPEKSTTGKVDCEEHILRLEESPAKVASSSAPIAETNSDDAMESTSDSASDDTTSKKQQSPDSDEAESEKKQILESMDISATPTNASSVLAERAMAAVKPTSSSSPIAASSAAAAAAPANLRSPVVPNFPKVAAVKRRASLPAFSGRGARLLEMSKAKGQAEKDAGGNMSSPSSNGTSSGSLMISPHLKRPAPPPTTSTSTSTDVPSTPTSSNGGSKPWQKFAPSPHASPSASILKKSISEPSPSPGGPGVTTPSSRVPESPLFGSGGPSSIKRRRVQFSDPPVSERVEIPRAACAAKSAARQQRMASTRLIKDFAAAATHAPPAKSPTENSQQQRSSVEAEEEQASSGLYVATPPLDTSSNQLYPSLAQCGEPITSMLAYLATPTWQKAAERSLTENAIRTVGNLAKLTAVEASALKGLKPPNNVATIQEALKRFDQTLQKREIRLNQQEATAAAAGKKLLVITTPGTPNSLPAPVVDVSTPEEEEQTMKELYERPSPSPSPTELELQQIAAASDAAEDEKMEEGEDSEKKQSGDDAMDEHDIGPPPPLISLTDDQIVVDTDKDETAGTNAGDNLLIPAALKNGSASQSTVRTSPSKACQTEEKQVPVHSRHCQASPEPVATRNSESMTEPEPTLRDTEVQVAPEIEATEVQTDEVRRSQDQVFEDLMRDLESVLADQPRMLVKVVAKCSELLERKM